MTLRIITTVWAPATATLPAGPYDLTSLANAHDELDIPAADQTKDARLARYITEASTDITSYCNRKFVVEGLTDLIYVDRASLPPRRPAGAAPLPLTRWPIANVAILSTGTDTPSGAILPFGSTAGVAAKSPVSGGGGGINNGTLETGANIPANTTVASLVANTSVTLSRSVLADVPASTPVTFGLSVWQLQSDGTLTGLVLNSDYTIDPDVGELFRLDQWGRLIAWEELPTSVAYYAGYATVPSDVEGAALRLLTNRWFAHGRDPALRERDHPVRGRETYWIGGPPKSGSLPEEVAGRLDRYRVRVAL